MEHQIYPEYVSEPSFNHRKFLAQVIDHWYLFLGCLLISLLVGWYKIHYATPMYRVNAQILIKDDRNGGAQGLSGSADGIAFSSLFNMKSNVYNELAILQTSDLYRKVVEDMNLNVLYYHKGSVREVELYKSSPISVTFRSEDGKIYPASFEIKFNRNRDLTITFNDSTILLHLNDSLKIGKTMYAFRTTGYPVKLSDTYIIRIGNPDYAAKVLGSQITAKLMDIKATVINLTYNTNLPEKGVEVVSNVMNAYINRDISDKNKISDSTLEFINSRIELVGADLSGIENNIQNFKQKNRISDFSAQSTQLVQNSGLYLQQSNELQVKLQVVQTMIDYLKQQQNNRRPVPALISNDPTFLGLVEKYNTLQIQRDRLLLSIKESNPVVANLDVQIENVRSDMLKSLQSQQESLLIAGKQLRIQNSEVDNLISKVPQKERQFLDISRQQDIKQALFSFLLQKKEETAISKASNVSNASIIQSAKADLLPYAPEKDSIFLLSVFVGLALPTAFIVIKSYLNNKVQNRSDISDATSVTIIAEIGHNKSSRFISLKDEGRSLIAEQFRAFRTNLEFTNVSKTKSTILFTSSMSGEGKSFIVANLGQMFAIAGKKVLIMEMDLRKPQLTKMLEVASNEGFTNLVTSNRPVSDFLITIPIEDKAMSLLPSGPIPPNPAELLLSDRMKQIMDELKLNFDILLIDSAPIGAVTDAVILGRYADVSAYVVRQNLTRIQSLQILNDTLTESKLPLPYIVFNDVRLKTSDKYGYGYQNGYGYGYHS